MENGQPLPVNQLPVSAHNWTWNTVTGSPSHSKQQQMLIQAKGSGNGCGLLQEDAGPCLDMPRMIDDGGASVRLHHIE